MNKKITRRVVLGTALGGLVACPFVLRALRRSSTDILGQVDGPARPQLVLPEGGIRQRFFSEWKQIFDRVNITPVEEKGIKTVMLSRKIPEAGTWNFCSLETNIVSGLTPNDGYSPENLLNYTVIEGVLRADPDSQNFVVSAQKHETVRLEIDAAESRKKGTKIDETLKEGKPSSVKIDPVVEYDSSTHSYTTSLVEKRAVQQGSLGEFAFTKDITIKDIKLVQPKNNDDVNRMILLLKLRSFLHFPFTGGEKKVGSVFATAAGSLLEQKFPYYQGKIERVARIGTCKVVEISPIFTSVEKFSEVLREDVYDEAKRSRLNDTQREQYEMMLRKERERLNRTVDENADIRLKCYVCLDSGLVTFREQHSVNNVHKFNTESLFYMS
ncbi:hypothetical protein FACS189454_08490 [Planctomycetales bacterium]|nr:hypothetical protein FACS189454_08490 [Planctomycetales bacterium]